MCDHKRLRTVGHEVYCQDCGEHLPLEFLTGQKPAETAPEAVPRRRTGKSTAKNKTPENGK